MNFETFGMKARNQQALETFVKEDEDILEAKIKCRHRQVENASNSNLFWKSGITGLCICVSALRP
jgi:hypothetical protein